MAHRADKAVSVCVSDAVNLSNGAEEFFHIIPDVV